MMRVINRFNSASLFVQGSISALCLSLYFLSSYFLEKSYLLSKFPVPYFEQQTSFDSLQMKAWYAHMLQEGTFGIYLRTQFIDFAFIAAVILAGFTLCTFLANLHPSNSFFHKWGRKLAFALPLAGGFDVLENLVSFFMIANPANFADALIIPYSTFAVIKFGCWTIGLISLLISVLALPISRFVFSKKISVATVLFIGLCATSIAQEQQAAKPFDQLIYIEADPFAYLNKGYSIHLGYENWGYRFDLTKVKVDFPESFEEAFYGTKAFDLVTDISGIKLDYIGNRSNWTRGAFVGLDINHQKQRFTHRASTISKNLSTVNLGVRAGYKINIFKGFYVTPWAALWRNVQQRQSFSIEDDIVQTKNWDWITTIHFGYALKLGQKGK